MTPSISEVRGIGPATAKTLAEQGIHSVADLAATHVNQLTAIPGFSDIRAAQVIDDAAQLLVDANESVNRTVDEAVTNPKPVLKVKQKKPKTKNKKTTGNKDKKQKVKVGKAKKSDKKVKDKDHKKAKKQSDKSGKVKSDKSKKSKTGENHKGKKSP